MILYVHFNSKSINIEQPDAFKSNFMLSLKLYQTSGPPIQHSLGQGQRLQGHVKVIILGTTTLQNSQCKSSSVSCKYMSKIGRNFIMCDNVKENLS